MCILPCSAAIVIDVISSALAKLQTHHPNTFKANSGDFNHISLSATLPTFPKETTI